MRIGSGLFFTLLILLAGGCSRQDASATARKAGQEAHQAAQRANQAAHEVAREGKQTVDKAGHELRQLGHSARQGWNESDRNKKP